MGSEELLKRMVKTLGIIIDLRLKGKPRKMECLTIHGKTGDGSLFDNTHW